MLQTTLHPYLILRYCDPKCHKQQGTAAHDANVTFLETLSSIVLKQREVEHSAVDPQQPSTSLGGELKTLEFACDRFPAITTESVPLFPSDITKMLHQYRHVLQTVSEIVREACGCSEMYE